MRSVRYSSLGVLVALLGSLLVAISAPAAYAADRDCSDFGSQRAAQIFFLKHGGPSRDPHRLDADSDGVACQTNPAPYYTKKVLPAAPVIDSAVRLKVRPSKAIAGERLKLKVEVRPEIKRTVVLQRKAPRAGWKRIDSARTSKGGTLRVKIRTAARTSRYRAVLAPTKINKKRYSAAKSEVRRVVTQKQAVVLSLPSAAVKGDRVRASAEVSPVRRGRDVVLQRRLASGEWARVDRGAESRTGHVQFRWRVEKRGRFTFRAVVSPERGAAAARSNKERLAVKGPTPEDTTPPPVPTGLTASAGNGLVELAWDPVSASDLAEYVVYGSTTAGGPAPVARVVGESYVARGLVNGTEYAFAVSAVDTSDNRSALSAAARATPVAPDTTPPPVPTGVTAVGGDARVTVGWDPVTAVDLGGYGLYQRELPNGFWTRITAISSPSTSATVTGLANGTTYEFAVASYDRSGNESAPSASRTATPLAPPPSAPSNLVATAGDGQVLLDWDAVSDPDVVGYRVYLRTAPSDTWTAAPQGLTTSTASVVSGLTNGVEHFFAAVALTADGTESDKSNTVSATPAAAGP